MKLVRVSMSTSQMTVHATDQTNKLDALHQLCKWMRNLIWYVT